jgi:hypothetical protein
MTTRRSLLTGLTGFVLCAPAIVRASSLMAVKALQVDVISGITILDDLPWITVTMRSLVTGRETSHRFQYRGGAMHRLSATDGQLVSAISVDGSGGGKGVWVSPEPTVWSPLMDATAQFMAETVKP